MALADVEEIHDLDQLEDRRLAWTALWRQSRQPSFFQSFDWLKTYWRHFGRDRTLRIVWARAGRETLGALPLAIGATGAGHAMQRRLGYAQDRWAPRCGPLGANPTATLWSGWRGLAALDDWDILDLRGVPFDSLDYGRTRVTLKQAGFSAHEAAEPQRLLAGLAGGWTNYLQLLGAQLAREVVRCQRKLAAQRPRFLRIRPACSLSMASDLSECLVETCWNLAPMAWRELLTRESPPMVMPTSGNPIDDLGLAWFRDIHDAAWNVGAADTGLLLLNDRPAAFVYGYAWEGRVEMLISASAAEAPSEAQTLLWHEYLRDSAARGDQWIDLGGHSPLSAGLSVWATGRASPRRYVCRRANGWGWKGMPRLPWRCQVRA